MQFVKIPSTILSSRSLTLGAKLVYAYLRDRQGGNGHAWPSLRTIASACGMSASTVHESVVRLEQAGLLQTNRPPGNPASGRNQYSVQNPSARRSESERSENTALGSECARHRKPSAERSEFGTDSDSFNQTQPDSVLSRPIAARSSRPNAAVLWGADSGWSGITEQDRAAWASAYPAVDVEQELARATVWLRANPAKACKRNYRRFLANWFSRTQDRGGTACVAPRGSQAASRGIVEDDWHADIGHVRPEVFEA